MAKPEYNNQQGDGFRRICYLKVLPRNTQTCQLPSEN
jgi:hypothetical protein